MMAREYGGQLIQTQLTQYSRLQMSGGVFNTWVTEGDGIRQAAASRWGVYDTSGPNAEIQARQFRNLTDEFVQRCP